MRVFYVLMVSLLLFSACNTPTSTRQATLQEEAGLTLEGEKSAGKESGGKADAKPQQPETKRFTVLAVNDLSRVEPLEHVRSIRKKLEEREDDVLFLHAGNLLYPSLLSHRYAGQQMVDVLNLLDGDATSKDPYTFVTFGINDLRHVSAEQLQKRIQESQFDWLTANIHFAEGSGIQAANLLPSKLFTLNGVKIGIFAITTPMQGISYVKAISDPVKAAKAMSTQLRSQGAEVVIALTHQKTIKDQNLLRDLGDNGPDMIFGGHTYYQKTAEINGRWMMKADPDAASVTVARVTIEPSGRPKVAFNFKESELEALPNPQIQRRVIDWMTRHEKYACAAEGREHDCLPVVLETPYEKLTWEKLATKCCFSVRIGGTRTKLVGENYLLRRQETNLGNWVADEARRAFAEQNAQIALIHADNLQLNRSVPYHADIKRRTLEELVPEKSALVLIRMKGALLQQVLQHSIKDWPEGEHFLQVSGLAFRHDPKLHTVDQLTLLLDAENARPIVPQEELLVVLNVNVLGQLGYSMLHQGLIVAEAPQRDLKAVLGNALMAGTIEPEVEGRICNVRQRGKCRTTTQSMSPALAPETGIESDKRSNPATERDENVKPEIGLEANTKRENGNREEVEVMQTKTKTDEN